jgi:hypothetical protein
MNKKRIFRCFVFSLLVVSFTLSLFSKKTINESVWTDNPIIVDGKNADWQDIQPLEKDKLKIDYAFKNDNHYLYVLFTFKDFKFLSSLSSSGITLWLNSKGKKKKRYGIKFLRRMITADHFIAILEKQHGPLPEDKKAEIKKKNAYTIYQNGVVNKNSETVIPIKVASAQAPAFKTAQGPGTMTFEFRVPLQNEEGKIVGIGTTPGAEIAVAFEWGGMTPEVKAMLTKKHGTRRGRSSKGGVSESIPGSSEMESGGSIRTGGGTRTQYPRSAIPKKYIVWEFIKLAEKK